MTHLFDNLIITLSKWRNVQLLCQSFLTSDSDSYSFEEQWVKNGNTHEILSPSVSSHLIGKLNAWVITALIGVGRDCGLWSYECLPRLMKEIKHLSVCILEFWCTWESRRASGTSLVFFKFPRALKLNNARRQVLYFFSNHNSLFYLLDCRASSS